MARDYAKISISIWQSRKFRGLKTNDAARLLYMYLHSCPQVNSVGCFNIPLGYIVTDLGWDEPAARATLLDLQSADLIEWDEPEEMVRIVAFIEHDSPTNPKHAAAMVGMARSLHDGKLKQAVIADLKKQKHCADNTELSAVLDSLSEHVSEALVPSLTPSLPIPFPNPHPHHPQPAGEPADDDDDGFNQFFQAMPKQENRKAAVETYRTARKKVSTAVLLASADHYARSCRGRGPQHILTPKKWLEDERWTDSTGPPGKKSAFSSAEELEGQRRAREKAENG